MVRMLTTNSDRCAVPDRQQGILWSISQVALDYAIDYLDDSLKYVHD